MSYQNGFEDALELCIAETEDSKDKQKALMKMTDILALVKEDKFENIKKRLGVLR
ncbi:MAG: hypothetical protein ACOWW1_05450 [archaeon]